MFRFVLQYYFEHLVALTVSYGCMNRVIGYRKGLAQEELGHIILTRAQFQTFSYTLPVCMFAWRVRHIKCRSNPTIVDGQWVSTPPPPERREPCSAASVTPIEPRYGVGVGVGVVWNWAQKLTVTDVSVAAQLQEDANIYRNTLKHFNKHTATLHSKTRGHLFVSAQDDFHHCPVYPC